MATNKPPMPPLSDSESPHLDDVANIGAQGRHEAQRVTNIPAQLDRRARHPTNYSTPYATHPFFSASGSLAPIEEQLEQYYGITHKDDLHAFPGDPTNSHTAKRFNKPDNSIYPGLDFELGPPFGPALDPALKFDPASDPGLELGVGPAFDPAHNPALNFDHAIDPDIEFSFLGPNEDQVKGKDTIGSVCTQAPPDPQSMYHPNAWVGITEPFFPTTQTPLDNADRRNVAMNMRPEQAMAPTFPTEDRRWNYGVETNLADLDQGLIADRNNYSLYNHMPSAALAAQGNVYHQQAFNQPLRQQANMSDVNEPLAGSTVAQIGDYYHQPAFGQPLQQQSNESHVTGPIAGSTVTKFGDYYHQPAFGQPLQQQSNESDVTGPIAGSAAAQIGNYHQQAVSQRPGQEANQDKVSGLGHQRKYKKRTMPSSKAGKKAALAYSEDENQALRDLMKGQPKPGSGKRPDWDYVAAQLQIRHPMKPGYPVRTGDSVQTKWWRLKGGDPKRASKERKLAQAAPES